MYTYIYYIIVLVKKGAFYYLGPLDQLWLLICSSWPYLDVMNTIESVNQLNYYWRPF